MTMYIESGHCGRGRNSWSRFWICSSLFELDLQLEGESFVLDHHWPSQARNLGKCTRYKLHGLGRKPGGSGSTSSGVVQARGFSTPRAEQKRHAMCLFRAKIDPAPTLSFIQHGFPRCSQRPIKSSPGFVPFSHGSQDCLFGSASQKLMRPHCAKRKKKTT